VVDCDRGGHAGSKWSSNDGGESHGGLSMSIEVACFMLLDCDNRTGSQEQMRRHAWVARGHAAMACVRSHEMSDMRSYVIWSREGRHHGGACAAWAYGTVSYCRWRRA
jgi:hypothetical protein